MSHISTVATQFANRPADQRFSSLIELNDFMREERDNSAEMRLSLKDVTAIEAPGNKSGLLLQGKNGGLVAPTSWAFRQACVKAALPTEYLSRLPGYLAAENLNYGLQQLDDETAKVKTLFRQESEGVVTLRAVTGPDYGRVPNHDITKMLVDRFGDGVNGQWRSPGEFGERIPVTRENATFFASDRDVFVFLCDESKSIAVKNRRKGDVGNMARGFYIYNSDVGAQTLGIACFYFDYVCKNRNIWGVQGFQELKFRHTKSLPGRWINDLAPQLLDYANSSVKPIEDQIARAQSLKVEEPFEFLVNKVKVTRPLAKTLMLTHQNEEDRPIETLFDVTTAITAHARSIVNSDDRVRMERLSGDVMEMAA